MVDKYQENGGDYNNSEKEIGMIATFKPTEVIEECILIAQNLFRDAGMEIPHVEIRDHCKENLN